MKIWPIIFAVVNVITVAQVAQAGPSLTDSQWQLRTLRGDSVRPQATLTIRSNGAVSGRGWCNAFGGKARITGNAIAFDGLMATMRACAEASLEADYHAALREVARWRIEGSRLILSGKGGGDLLVFGPAGTTVDGLPEDLPDGG